MALCSLQLASRSSGNTSTVSGYLGTKIYMDTTTLPGNPPLWPKLNAKFSACTDCVILLIHVIAFSFTQLPRNTLLLIRLRPAYARGLILGNLSSSSLCALPAIDLVSVAFTFVSPRVCNRHTCRARRSAFPLSGHVRQRYNRFNVFFQNRVCLPIRASNDKPNL